MASPLRPESLTFAKVVPIGRVISPIVVRPRAGRFVGADIGRYARFTSGGQGSYTINGEYGEYDNKAGNPKEEEVWTLEKNLCGCWQITEFEFH